MCILPVAVDNDDNAREIVKRVLLCSLVKTNVDTTDVTTLNDPIMIVCSLGSTEASACSDTNCRENVGKWNTWLPA